MIKDNIVHGPPLPFPTPDVSAGLILYRQLMKHAYGADTDKAFVDEATGSFLTYQQLLQLSCSLAEALRKDGISGNDVIALCSENNIYFFIVVMAGLLVGLPITTINPVYTETEFQHALDLTYPSRIFCSKNFYKKFVQIQSKRDHIKRIVVTNGGEDGPASVSLMDFIREHGTLHTDAKRFIPTPLHDPQHVAFILFSSGTTGLPKGVMTTHKNVNARLMSLYDPRLWFHTDEPNSIGVLPFFHAYGLQIALGDVFNGRTVYVLEKFEPVPYLRGIEKYRIPFVAAVPVLMVFLAQHPIVDQFDLSCVKDVLYGSAVTSMATVEAFKKSDPQLWYQSTNPHVLGLLPFFHAFGLQMILGYLFEGRTVHVLKQFEPLAYLGCIDKHRIDNISVVPTLLTFLASHPIVDKFDLSCLKDVGYGSSPASPAVLKAFTERLNITPRQGYGLTEATLAVTAVPFGTERPGSVGPLYPGMSAYIRDQNTGRRLGPREVGEICLKGDLVMKGYYKNEAATRETFTEDGFLRTGDVGYFDEDEYFYVVDRMKELIKYKSFQVAPAELEAILVTHPKIKQAAVVGLPDEKVGELPMAFIVKEPATDLTEGEVKSYLAGLLSKHKHLHGGVVFVNEIPLNSLGKISRKEVRQLLSTFKSKL